MSERLEMLPCWLCGDTELDGGCYPCGPVHPENKSREWWRCTCGNPDCYARTGIEDCTREGAIQKWNAHPYRALKEEAHELWYSFDLRWKADMRAIKCWQEAHPGSELTWPDHADLVVWLLEQVDDLRLKLKGKTFVTTEGNNEQ